LVNRAARASRPSGIDPSRKITRRQGTKKPDLYAAAAVCTKVRSRVFVPSRCLNGRKGHCRSLKRFVCVRFRSGSAVSLRGYRYFFRDVFFATFLVAFAVFFAF